MAKDATKHIDHYKVDGQKLNEFEFTQNHGDITEEEQQRFARQQAEREGREGEAQPPQTEAERIQHLMDDVREKVQRRKGNARASAKKSAGQAAAKSGAAKSGAAKSGGSKKGASKKGGAAKKSAQGRGGSRRG